MTTLASKSLALSVLLLIVVAVFCVPNTNATKRVAQRSDCSRVDDATLTTRVQEKIDGTAALAGQHIEVEARSGVVTLRGTVSAITKARLAARVAGSVGCVRRVVNSLQVGKPIGKDELCCCDGVCWHQSKCPTCSGPTKACITEYKAAIEKAGGNKDLLDAARDAFEACKCSARQ